MPSNESTKSRQVNHHPDIFSAHKLCKQPAIDAITAYRLFREKLGKHRKKGGKQSNER